MLGGFGNLNDANDPVATRDLDGAIGAAISDDENLQFTRP
jgi:hypothetical protein